MARVVILSDVPQASTGYGVAAFYLGKYLARKGHEVAYVGFQHVGGPVYVELEGEGNLLNMAKVYEGAVTLSMERAFKEFTPDLGIHIRDAFAHSPKFFQGAYSLMSLKNRPKIVLWTPVQNDMLPQEFVDACSRECDLCVSFTEWGKEVLVFQGVPYNRLEAISLGYDPEVFSPKDVNKEEYGFSNDRPLIGSVGINDQHRKGWPILVKAVSLLKKKMDVDLYLHTTPEGAFLIPHHEAQVGMRGQAFFPQGYSKTWGQPPGLTGELYNCFDVYATASIEEGFNLPPLENLAVGNPVVATDMPVHREVLGDYGFYAKATKTYPTGWSYGWLADPEDMAAQLESAIAYRQSPSWKDERQKQLEYVKKFSWENVAAQWEALISKHTELGVKV